MFTETVFTELGVARIYPRTVGWCSRFSRSYSEDRLGFVTDVTDHLVMIIRARETSIKGGPVTSVK
jgi:hypothetical protein